MSNAGASADLSALFEAARAARAMAHAPYSRFKVGAALRADSGAVYAGCNVENAAYPSGICAETAAIAAMVTAGERRIAEILVLGEGAEPLTPCGACRQRILEFATPRTRIHCASEAGAALTRSMDELLPHAFGPDRLAEGRPS